MNIKQLTRLDKLRPDMSVSVYETGQLHREYGIRAALEDFSFPFNSSPSEETARTLCCVCDGRQNIFPYDSVRTYLSTSKLRLGLGLSIRS